MTDMTKALDLEPCPFCGAPAAFCEATDSDGRFIAVECTGCGCGSGKHYPLMDDAHPNAANEWNRRTLKPVAYITKAGLASWLAGAYADSRVLLRDPGNLRVTLYADTSDTRISDPAPLDAGPDNGDGA